MDSVQNKFHNESKIMVISSFLTNTGMPCSMGACTVRWLPGMSTLGSCRASVNNVGIKRRIDNTKLKTWAFEEGGLLEILVFVMSSV